MGFTVLRFLLQETSVFRFWWSLRFPDFSFFSIWFSVFVKNTSGFSVLVPDVVFGFSHFVLFWVSVSVVLSTTSGVEFLACTHVTSGTTCYFRPPCWCSKYQYGGRVLVTNTYIKSRFFPVSPPQNANVPDCGVF